MNINYEQIKMAAFINELEKIAAGEVGLFAKGLERFGKNAPSILNPMPAGAFGFRKALESRKQMSLPKSVIPATPKNMFQNPMLLNATKK